MKKIGLKITCILAIVILGLIGLVACAKEPEYVIPTDLQVTYGSTLADITLPEGFTFQDELTTSVGEVGQQTFLVTYTPEDTKKFKTITDIEVIITVVKGTSTYNTAVVLSATYGQTLADVQLPAGLTWQEATTTSVGNAGANIFHAVFTPTDIAHYSVIQNIPVTINVAKANYNMTGVSLSGASYTYDGQSHSLAVSGTLPEGLSVEYENNAKTNAGTYEVIARFIPDDNHNAPESLRANLVITKANIQGLLFDGIIVTYDGQPHSLQVTGVPAGVTVDYTNNGKTNAGTYQVTAHFNVGTNYNEVPDMHATLKINKAIPTFEVPTFNTPVSISSVNEISLPEHFSWTSTQGMFKANTYRFLVTYDLEDPNYQVVNDIPVDFEYYNPSINYDTVHYIDGDEVDHRCIAYTKGTTFRLVRGSSDSTTYSALLTLINSESIWCFSYSGDVTSKTESELDEIVPTHIYTIYQGYMFGDSAFWACVNVHQYQPVESWPILREQKYAFFLDSSTYVFTIAELGETQYVYASIEDNMTIAFNKKGEGNETEYYALYFYGDIYDKDSVPWFSDHYDIWSQQDNVITLDVDYKFIIGNDGTLTYNVQRETQKYIYGYIEDYTGTELFIVLSFIEGENEGEGPVYRYVFDEPVDISTVDLSAYTPSLATDYWDVDEVDDNDNPISIYLYDGGRSFNVLDNGALELYYGSIAGFNYTAYIDPMTKIEFLFNYDMFIRNAQSYGTKLGTWDFFGQGYTQLVAHLYSSPETPFYFDITTRNLGSLVCHTGEIVGVYEWSDGIYSAYVVDGNKRKEISYYNCTIEEVLSGNVNPVLCSNSSTWKEENGYINLSIYDETVRIFKKHQNKQLTVYTGEKVWEYSDTIANPGHNDYTIRYEMNNVFGNRLAFYYVDGILQTDIYKWEYSDIAKIVTIYEYLGGWTPIESYNTIDEDVDVYEADKVIAYFGYAYMVEKTSPSVYTWTTYVFALNGRNNEALVWALDGKKLPAEIPSFSDLMEIDSIGECEWYISDGIELCILNGPGNEDDESYELYYDGINLYTLSKSVSIDYFFQYNDDFQETVVYLRDEQNDDNINWYFGYIVSLNEVKHMLNPWVEEITWEDVQKNNQTYIILKTLGKATDVILVDEDENGNKFENYVTGDVVYVIDQTYTIAFCDILGLAKVALRIDDATGLTKIQAQQALNDDIDITMVGIWVQDGNYVLLNNLEGSDPKLYEVNEQGNLEVSANEYKGVVKDVIVCGPIGYKYTIAFIEYFGELYVIYYNGEHTITEIQDYWDADNQGEPIDEGNILADNLYLIDKKIYEYKNGTVNEAEGETIYYYKQYNEPLYVFNKYGDNQIILMPWDLSENEPISDIADGFKASDGSQYTIFGGCEGRWIVDSSDSKIIQIIYNSSVFYCELVNVETGEVTM